MSTHLFMGAINKLSNERENPKFADKKNKYKCPECEIDVIFKKGKIKIPHFAHKVSEIKCTFYDKPSESQIHKEAKILMKSILDNKKDLMFYRKCTDCDHTKYITIKYNENTKAVIEYKFNYNDSNKSADVALIDDNNIKYIFEICYKNKTNETNRPEPWFEIDAVFLIKNINENNDYNLECIRNYNCEKCMVQKEKQRQFEIEKQQIRMEKIKEKKELEERKLLLKLEEERMEQECSCKIKFKCLCICTEPNFELCRLSNHYYCKTCNLWKCRCYF